MSNDQSLDVSKEPTVLELGLKLRESLGLTQINLDRLLILLAQSSQADARPEAQGNSFLSGLEKALQNIHESLRQLPEEKWIELFPHH